MTGDLAEAVTKLDQTMEDVRSLLADLVAALEKLVELEGSPDSTTRSTLKLQKLGLALQVLAAVPSEEKALETMRLAQKIVAEL